MKKILVNLLFILLILFSVSFSTSSQVYVKTRPVIPVIAVTAQPGTEYIWVGEEWERNGRTYRYSGSHWETPPHPNYTRKPGHWRLQPHYGQEWIRGSWKKA